jgi:hypothetical protein
MMSSTPVTETAATIAKPKRAVRIRPATFEDYAPISAVEKRNGLVIRSREEWIALWAENPAYRGLQGHWDIGWVMETPASEIVGTFSSVPLAYRFNGADLRAAIGVGWAVDVPYRAYSIWLLQSFLKQRKVDLFVSTTTSPEAEPVLQFLKWSPAPVGQWRKSCFWITGHRGFLNAALHKKNIHLPGWISSPAAALWSGLDRLRNAAFSRGGSCSALAVERCTTFDERFEEFWKTLEHGNRNVLLAVRSSETLQWHFRSALARNDLWIVTAAKNGTLVGYAVFDREDKPRSGLRRARLVDFVALESEEDVLRSLLCWMLDRCSKQNIHMIEVFGCWLDRPELAGVRFPYQRTLPSCLYYYYTPDQKLREALSSKSVWRPSSFDGDASLGTWAQPPEGADPS